MFTQPINEDDPNYYEKETARLAQEQAMIAIDLMAAWTKVFSEMVNRVHKDVNRRIWNALLGDYYTDEVERSLES